MRSHALLVCGCVLGSISPAFGNWYSGDPYSTAPATPLAAFYLPPTFTGFAFETFTWPSGANAIDRVGGHYYDFNNNSPATIAHWEIRTGVAPGNPGTTLFSGTSLSPTLSATPFTHGPFHVFRIEVDIPDFNLPAGSYSFTMAVDNGWFVANTAGANSVNAMPTDNSAIYTNTPNPLDPFYYVEMGTGGIGSPGVDSSYFIKTVIPEPTTVFALAGAMAMTLRRKRT